MRVAGLVLDAEHAVVMEYYGQKWRAEMEVAQAVDDYQLLTQELSITLHDSDTTARI